MEFLNALSASEKKTLKYSIVALVLLLAWAFVYKPLNKHLDTKLAYQQRIASEWQQMQKLKSQFNPSQLSPIRNNNKPFISWIDEQIEKHNLSQFVTRSEPKDNKTLVVTFENVVFDELVNWLEPLESTYHIKISETDINLVDSTNGLCNVRLTLSDN